VDEADDAELGGLGGVGGRRGLRLAQLEALEEDAPGLLYGRGIGAPALELRFDEVEVPAGGERGACHMERLLPGTLRSSRYSIVVGGEAVRMARHSLDHCPVRRFFGNPCHSRSRPVYVDSWAVLGLCTRAATERPMNLFSPRTAPRRVRPRLEALE